MLYFLEVEEFKKWLETFMEEGESITFLPYDNKWYYTDSEGYTFEKGFNSLEELKEYVEEN